MLFGAKVDKGIVLDLLHSLHRCMSSESFLNLCLGGGEHQVTNIEYLHLWYTIVMPRMVVCDKLMKFVQVQQVLVGLW